MNGHGHVIPNADGAKARCGGPGICAECSREQARFDLDKAGDTIKIKDRVKAAALDGESEPVRFPKKGGEFEVTINSRTYAHRTMYPDEITEYRDRNRWIYDNGARGKDAVDYDGHGHAWAVVIEEHDYLKQSELSGDEVRKGGLCRLFLNSEQVYEFFTRDARKALVRAAHYMDRIQDMAHDYPGKVGDLVWYREQPAKIVSVVKDQGCVILARRDGQPWRDDEWGDEQTVKIDVVETGLTGYWPHEDRL